MACASPTTPSAARATSLAAGVRKWVSLDPLQLTLQRLLRSSSGSHRIPL